MFRGSKPDVWHQQISGKLSTTTAISSPLAKKYAYSKKLNVLDWSKRYVEAHTILPNKRNKGFQRRKQTVPKSFRIGNRSF